METIIRIEPYSERKLRCVVSPIDEDLTLCHRKIEELNLSQESKLTNNITCPSCRTIIMALRGE